MLRVRSAFQPRRRAAGRNSRFCAKRWDSCKRRRSTGNSSTSAKIVGRHVAQEHHRADAACVFRNTKEVLAVGKPEASCNNRTWRWQVQPGRVGRPKGGTANDNDSVGHAQRREHLSLLPLPAIDPTRQDPQ
jgi:hypothetical protein